MKNMNWLRTVIALMLVAAFSSQVLAAWGRGDKIRQLDQGKMIESIVKKLDLTKEQTDKFTAQAQATQKVVEADRAKIKELGDKLKDELRQDSPDKAAVHDLITQISRQLTALRIARTDSLLELQSTLTPEQKTKFREMLNKKGGKMPFGFGGSRHKS